MLKKLIPLLGKGEWKPEHFVSIMVFLILGPSLKPNSVFFQLTGWRAVNVPKS